MRTVFPLIDISLSGTALNISRPSAPHFQEASFAYYLWQLAVIGESSSNSGQRSRHLRSAAPVAVALLQALAMTTFFCDRLVLAVCTFPAVPTFGAGNPDRFLHRF
jgi:hypothetical protein